MEVIYGYIRRDLGYRAGLWNRGRGLERVDPKEKKTKLRGRHYHLRNAKSRVHSSFLPSLV